jgi:hypothetical protein
MFEPYGEDTAQKIGDDIYRNLVGEPRIETLKIDLQLSKNEPAYTISVFYRIKATTQVDNINFTLQAL